MKYWFSALLLLLFCITLGTSTNISFVFAQAATSTPSVDTQALIRQFQDLVASLQKQILELQTQLKITRGDIETVKTEIKELKLTRSLQRGITGGDVKQLQEFLSTQYPDLYPTKQITGYFGPATEAAVKKLQEKHGIESIGIVGPKTIAKLNELTGLLHAPRIQPSAPTSTPSGTIPALPATPAQPIGQAGTTTVPATPATPGIFVPPPPPPPNQLPPPPATATTTPPAALPPPPPPAGGQPPPPPATPITDTAAPSTPTNISVVVQSDSKIAITWAASTDNVGVTGYRIYRGGTQIATVTTGTSYSDTGLAAATAYSYTVAAYDAVGNVSAQSSPVSAATLSPGPPAPTNVQVVTTSSSQQQPPQMWYYLIFNYTLQSTTQSFNVYRKRPTDASFVKYTYSAQMPVNPSILPLPGSNESNLYRRESNQWSWYTTLTGLASDAVRGEYKFYVTAVDTGGVASNPSETKSFKLYAAPGITNPADSSTVSAPFTITVSGDPNAPSPTYGMALYKNITGDTAWSAWPAPSTNFTYTGQALNPNDNPHRLVVWFSSGIYDRSLFGTSIFNVSTTISSLDLRAKNLANISQTLDTIREQLLKLLQGF